MIVRPTLVEYEDYARDYETSNTSFLYIAKLLKDKGIENYDFMLIVKNEEVIGLDPYDKDLTKYQKKLIAEEVSENYFYYIREIARIPVAGSGNEIGGGDRYTLHRGNLAMAYLQEFNINLYVVLPRQTGKTWGILQRILWEFNFATTNSQFLFMHLNKAGSVMNLKRLKDARALLPEYLQNNYSRDDKTGKIVRNTDNVNELRNANKNEIITKASAKTRIAADNLGRGMTQPKQFYDEFAFTLYNDIIWEAATPAFLKAAATAKRYGRPYSINIATTPGDLGTAHGEYAYKMFMDSTEFSEKFYDLEADTLLKTIEKNGSSILVRIEFSYRQLQQGEEYFEKGAKALGWNWSKIRRELLNQWVNSTNDSPFDPDDLHELTMNKKEPIGALDINRFYEMKLYRDYSPADKVLISVDPSKGIGRDSTAVVVIDVESEEIIGIFRSSRMPYPELQRFLETLILDQFPNSTLVIENNIGRSIIQYMLDSPLRHHVYGEVREQIAEVKYNDGSVQQQKNKTMVYGIPTSSKTRPVMFDMLLDYVVSRKNLLTPDALVGEISTLQYKTATKIEHASGKHDDVVMAYLVGMYTLYHGTNLMKYGIQQKGIFGEQKAGYDPQAANMLKRVRHKRVLEEIRGKNPMIQEMVRNIQSKTIEQIEDERLRRRYQESISENDGMSYYVTNNNQRGLKMAKLSTDNLAQMNKGKKISLHNGTRKMTSFLNSLDL